MGPGQAPATGIPARRERGYFYGWNIVGAAFLANFAAAEHNSSVLGLFFKPLGQEFGWKRTAIAGVQTVARLVEALVTPFIGPIVDRRGPRVLMVLGAVIVGFAMLAVTQVTTLWHFYLLRGGVVAVGFSLMGGLVPAVTVSNWFVRRRGRAIAIAGLGTNVGSVIMVPVTVWVLAVSGWRTSFVIFGVVTWLAVLVPAALLMRRRPEDMGLHPDGMAPDNAGGGHPGPEGVLPAPSVAFPLEPVWSRREVLGNLSFWLLVASFAFANLAFQGINISLVPYMQDLRYGDALVVAVVTFRALTMAAALPAWGFMSERAQGAWLRVTPFLLQGAASFLFLLADRPPFLWLAVVVYAFGFAGVAVVQEVMWANYYGRFSLGLVRSTAWPFAFGFAAVGPIFMNLIFDITGSYRPAYILFIGFYTVASFLMWFCRPPKARRYARPEERTP